MWPANGPTLTVVALCHKQTVSPWTVLFRILVKGMNLFLQVAVRGAERQCLICQLVPCQNVTHMHI